MANELQHKDAGLELTRVEDNAVDRHFCDGQVAGDIIYAQDGTVLRRLAVGSNGDVLWLNGGLPAWKTPGIADNDPLAVDDAAAASGEHARFTANGLEGIDLVSARAYQTNAQTLERIKELQVLLDTENWDTGTDMDITVRTANCDATQAFKLHDADGGFEAGDAGATVWNTTDDTYAMVSAFVDSGELTLDTDIMVNGEGYKLFRSWFVCPDDGKYLVCGGVRFAGLGNAVTMLLSLRKNNTGIAAANTFALGAAVGAGMVTAEIMDCTAGDKITMYTYHSDAAAEALSAGSHKVFMSVHRLS